jgi:hypothetical protein
LLLPHASHAQQHVRSSHVGRSRFTGAAIGLNLVQENAEKATRLLAFFSWKAISLKSTLKTDATIHHRPYFMFPFAEQTAPSVWLKREELGNQGPSRLRQIPAQHEMTMDL